MTIQQVVELLKNERQGDIPSRFPCRAVMVRNIAEYCQLLSELKKIRDIRVVKSSELFSSADTMPKYEKLMDSRYQDEWIILTGVSEYLRLFSKKEAADRMFSALWGYKAPASSRGRIIIPLWGCEAQWYDSALNLVGDSRQQDYFYNCSDPVEPEQYLSISVLSGLFEQYVDRMRTSPGSVFIGLKNYFEYWENPIPENTQLILLTKRVKSVVPVRGEINVHVVKDMLSFIKENLSGSNVLNSQNCSEDMQRILFEYALKEEHIDSALLRILNVSKFVEADVMAKWATFSVAEREFVRLWILLHPTDTYLQHCFSIAETVESVPYVICHEILKVRLNRPEWVNEYKYLSKAMVLKPDNDYLREVDNIADFDVKMDFLSGRTRIERIYLLHMMGKWMREDSKEALSDKRIISIYPELAAYLSCDLNVLNGELGKYLSSYKAHKLENTLPNDEDVYFNGIKTEVYDYRYSILSDFIDKDTVILWIDALGVEWLTLLQWSISRQCNASIVGISVVQATLPTETCFNEQWKHMDVPYDKLDKLDKLAHKGVIDEPDYYSCIEEQFSFITSSATNRIKALLKQYHRVIITGDHGTSRLAARFFHVHEGISAPKDSIVYSHGRYCETSSNNSMALNGCRIVAGDGGKKYIVFENYNHFKQSGFAAGADDENAKYGEVHGGATPEEMLVPVIIVDSNEEVPLKGTWEKTSVKIVSKKSKFQISFNKTVSDLSITIAGITGSPTRSNTGTKWVVSFEKLKPGTYLADVIADGHILTMPEVTVIPALSGGMGDLP